MENRIEDRDGIWELSEEGGTWELTEPSKEFLADLDKPVVEETGPTQEELDFAAFEIKLIDSLIGLGLI